MKTQNENTEQELFEVFKLEVETLRTENESLLKRLGKLNNAECTTYQLTLGKISTNNALINQGLGKIQGLKMAFAEIRRREFIKTYRVKVK